MILGYNVSVSIGGKTILARTQEDLTIAAQVKESITKDDQGVTRRKVTGHDVSFRISARAILLIPSHPVSISARVMDRSPGLSTISSRVTVTR